MPDRFLLNYYSIIFDREYWQSWTITNRVNHACAIFALAVFLFRGFTFLLFRLFFIVYRSFEKVKMFSSFIVWINRLVWTSMISACQLKPIWVLTLFGSRLFWSSTHIWPFRVRWFGVPALWWPDSSPLPLSYNSSLLFQAMQSYSYSLPGWLSISETIYL